MTKHEFSYRAPFIRAGVIVFLFSALMFYIGYRMSGILGGRVFSPSDPFGGCSSFKDYFSAWVGLISPSMIGFILIFVSAFSPFCPLVCAGVIGRQFFCLGIMFSLFSPGCGPIFASELFSSLAGAFFAAISLAEFSSLRRIDFKRKDGIFYSSLRYGADLLMISGATAFIYLPAAVISHIF